MIYSIREDAVGAIVYDPRLPDALVVDPVLSMSDNAFGSLRFRMFKTHPRYGEIAKRRTIYSVYRDSETNPIFRGICVEGNEDIDSAIEYRFEDFMSVLRDSMQDPFEHQGTIVEFLTMCLDKHNAEVEEWQKIRLGYVTVTDPNDYIYRASESEISTWEAIKTRLIDLLGGHVRIRYLNGLAYLDYLKGDTSELDPYIDTSTQTIEIGENLKEFSRVISSSDTYSACIPKGAETEFFDEDGQPYKQRLTVADVNDGSKYLINEEAVALYGFRCAPLDLTTWDDVTLPENLKRKGREFLDGTLVKLANTIKITAVDLRHLGIASDSFGFLNYVRVSISTANIDQIYILSSITIPLDDPSEVNFTLGETFLTMADRQAQQSAQIGARLDNVEQKIENDNALTQLEQTATELRSLIEQTGAAILSQVSEIYTRTTTFDQYKREVSTALEQTARSFEFRFNSITQQITTLDGSTTSRFSQINRYIRFIDGAIYLGEEGNPLILKIANDRISFYANNVEIAYFSAGRLFVDRLEAITSLTLGSYAFLPNNTGGMTLKYIGT